MGEGNAVYSHSRTLKQAVRVVQSLLPVIQPYNDFMADRWTVLTRYSSNEGRRCAMSYNSRQDIQIIQQQKEHLLVDLLSL